MSKPVAVLISDIHFTVATLEIASAALLKAQYEAKKLNVPLIICGDTLDSKAIIRAECMNKLMQMLSVKDKTKTYIIVGNHDLCNEKGDAHSLNFLWGFCEIVDKPTSIHLRDKEIMLIPYQSDISKLKLILEDKETPRTLIMHQGVQTAHMGHYIQDKTSLSKSSFVDFRVISGHYHRTQDIRCGRPRQGAIGLFSYIGTPYTTSFAEALDGPKGFQVLGDDGLLTLVPINLRKHVILERTMDNTGYMNVYEEVKEGDLVWLKVKGTHSELSKLNKKELESYFPKLGLFKLEKIYTDEVRAEQKLDKLSDSEIIDSMIDGTGETLEQKAYLKGLWREII